MNTNRERFLNRTTAPWAKLACPAGVYLWSCSTSVFSFIEREKEELTPACIGHAFAYVRLAKAIDIEFLNKDNAITVDQVTTQFVVKVTALIGNLLVATANLVSQVTVLLAAFATTRTHLLQLRQSFLTGPEPTRIFDHLTGRQGSEIFKPHVNANALGWRGEGFGVGPFHLKHGVPVAQIVPLDDHHLDNARAEGPLWVGQRTMLDHSHRAYPLNVEPIALYPKPITVDVTDRFKPILTFVAGIAWLLTRLNPTKEASKGFVQPAQGLLNRGVIDKGGILIELTNRLELISLVNVVKALVVHLPGQPALGQGVVVQSPVNFQDALKGLSLFPIRIKAVFVGQQHLISRLGLNVLATCLRGNVTRRAHGVGASPQTGQAALELRKFIPQIMRSRPFDAGA
jgi:hypothetical protein